MSNVPRKSPENRPVIQTPGLTAHQSFQKIGTPGNRIGAKNAPLIFCNLSPVMMENQRGRAVQATESRRQGALQDIGIFRTHEARASTELRIKAPDAIQHFAAECKIGTMYQARLHVSPRR